MLQSIYINFFYQPILNLLVFLYNAVPGNDLGVAIILLTIIIKLVLLPLSKKSIKSQKAMQDLQPKIEELKKKFKDNKEEMGRAMMELYKNNKVNPLSSCLPILIQLPFLIAVFRVFSVGLSNGTLDLIYPFLHNPGILNQIAFGFVDLSAPNKVLAVMAGAAQFWQTKMMSTKRPQVIAKGSKDEDMMAMMNKQMLFMMPIITIVIGFSLPGGLTFYWLTTTLLTIAQQFFIFKKDNNQNAGSVEVVDIK